MSSHHLPKLSLRTVAYEALPVMLVQLFSFGLAQLDIWIVGACCSSAELAVYGVARRMSLLVAIPLTQISLIVSSSISELYARGDRAQLQRIVKGAATISVLATLVPVVAMSVLAAPLLELVFGAGFRGGAELLRILLLGQLVFALTGPCGVTLMMTGHQRASLWSLLAAVPVYVFAPWAVTTYGPAAVAIIFALSTSVQNVVQWMAARIVLGIETQPCFSSPYIVQLSRAWEGKKRVPLGDNA
jgi:O-antigen/teichoic acid export membrane protein